MVLGIVGSEGAKFTAKGEASARALIRDTVQAYKPTLVVSGACHLGGIDVWAREECEALGVPFKEFPPQAHAWSYYRARNLKIAKAADKVICITVEDLPPGYVEHGWERYCYHCNASDHIKSGGCWTVKQAQKLGKDGDIFVIPKESL